MCINVYLSCDHGCRYCYVNSYSFGVGKGRRRPRFIETLKQDIADFRSLGMPPGPVHVSNSTDLFQEELEKRYRDTYNTLKILSENKDLFSEITILTKNPCMVLEEPGYLDRLELMKDKLNVEITIPFFRDNYRDYEPYAPHPQARLDAMNKLSHMGFNVRLRLDPIFPAESGIQTKDDISNILDRSSGVQCVISKPLRLVIPKNQVSDEFFDEMKSFYEGGKHNGVLHHHTRYVYSADRSAKEMKHLRDECVKRNIHLVHCMETVLVDEQGIPIINHPRRKQQGINLRVP
jgi:DNA repair photolyase